MEQNRVCTACSAGTYGQGGVTCKLCDAGYACPLTKMASLLDASVVSCVPPSVGLRDTNPYKCTSCLSGNEGCRGYVVVCDSGQYLNTTQFVCAPCPAGTFSSAPRSAASLSVALPMESCTLCPVSLCFSLGSPPYTVG